MKKFVLTDDHEATFDRHVQKWQSKLNLQDWRIEKGGGKASRGVMAEVSISLEDRLAMYRLSRQWGMQEPTDHALDATALHEMLHVFLRPLIEAAVSRDEAMIGQVEHSVITVLEKIISKG